MTNNEILKLIDYIKTENKNEAIKMLQRELLKLDGKSVKLADAVKRYLKQIDNSRPILKNVINKNGKQYLCNGYTAYRFDEYRQELETLDNTSMCDLDFEWLFTTKNFDELCDDDLTLLKNIKKYIPYLKTRDYVTDKYIYFCKNYYSAELIKQMTELLEFAGDNIKCVNIERYKGLEATNGKTTARILPLRLKDEQERQARQQTRDFLESLKNA